MRIKYKQQQQNNNKQKKNYNDKINKDYIYLIKSISLIIGSWSP